MQARTIQYGPLVLRLALAASLALGGLPKLLTANGHDPARITDAFRGGGIEPAAELVVAAGALELLGALALALGLFGRTAAVLLAVETAVLSWRLHFLRGAPQDWIGRSGAPPAIELSILLIGGLACLALTGAGAFSLDHRRARDAEAKQLGQARLRRRV